MGKLYLVSTPIGNLKDISLRAFKTLSTADIVACEDTRKTGLLISRITSQFKGPQAAKDDDKLRPKLLSFFEGNEDKRIPQIVNFILNGKDVALVSSAGTPAISDPGFKLVRECHRQGIVVSVVPGPSAAISALVVSGFPTDKFIFLGYLPKKENKKLKALENVKKAKELLSFSTIVFASPYRIKKDMAAIQKTFGNIEIAVVQELTKKFENIEKLNIARAIDDYRDRKVKGEFVLIF